MIVQSDILKLRSNGARQEASTLKLISALCGALKLEQVAYCHWKSNDVLDRSATGDNDLDLLVLNEHAPRFTQVLCRLGFKQAQAPADQSMPGVLDYYGYDKDTGRIVHVHAHFRLVIGDDRAKNYRLPVEKAYLANTSERLGFPTPEPEFEFVVFVIRMMLKHCSWDAVLAGKGRLKRAVRSEFEHLRDRVDLARAHDILSRHLPFISPSLFAKCVRSLEPGASLWSRTSTAWRLQKVLDAHTRRTYLANVGLKAWRHCARTLRRRTRGRMTRRRLASGGAIIALVGGDGAGKSTAVNSVESWLAEVFATQQCHLGKPRWSWAMSFVIAFIKIRRLCGLCPNASAADEVPKRFPGYAVLTREVCRARDRYRAYVKARRFANQGGIVICDRFPIPQIKSMDSARIEALTQNCRGAWLIKLLRRIEQAYYDAIAPPELLVVLRLDPEIAVQRRVDEDAALVRARSGEIWRLDDSQLDAHVVDASRDKEEVLSEIKQLIWSAI